MGWSHKFAVLFLFDVLVKGAGAAQVPEQLGDDNANWYTATVTPDWLTADSPFQQSTCSTCRLHRMEVQLGVCTRCRATFCLRCFVEHSPWHRNSATCLCRRARGTRSTPPAQPQAQRTRRGPSLLQTSVTVHRGTNSNQGRYSLNNWGERLAASLFMVTCLGMVCRGLAFGSTCRKHLPLPTSVARAKTRRPWPTPTFVCEKTDLSDG